jgi:hypothetical protein
MKPETLFPDDDIHDTAEDWKDGTAVDASSKRQIPNRRTHMANRGPGTSSAPAVHRMLPAAGMMSNRQCSTEPKPYHNGTQPSRAAAESARKFARSQTSRVHEFVASQGEHGATDKEIQTALNLDGNSQRPRRVWLRDHGFIQAKGEPEDITLRDGSTVWISIRPLANSVTADQSTPIAESLGVKAGTNGGLEP